VLINLEFASGGLGQLLASFGTASTLAPWLKLHFTDATISFPGDQYDKDAPASVYVDDESPLDLDPGWDSRGHFFAAAAEAMRRILVEIARLGLGWEDCKKLNPKLVMCSISGFGQTGPNASRPGYAHIAHSMTGWLAMQFLHHTPPETPRGPGIAIADVVTGISAFGAICAALFKRELSGEGEYIDIALFDSLFAANDMSLQNYLITGEISVFHHPVHKTKDGYLTANVGPDFRAWENVCKAMGKEQLLRDPRFASQAAVMANREAATAEVRNWLAGLTTEEAERKLVAHHVVTGIVKTLDQAARQPQVLARELITQVDDPVLGRIDVMNSSIKYLNSEARVRGPAPMLGEHNAEVLAEVLGYSKERIAALRDKGVLQSAER